MRPFSANRAPLNPEKELVFTPSPLAALQISGTEFYKKISNLAAGQFRFQVLTIKDLHIYYQSLFLSQSFDEFYEAHCPTDFRCK
ncbi:hypothetical protein I2I05_11215 [Hymenobacter sp. BT683]|uniref:Uncharacterized protein n=1 Tax=Hymenobacter jeongseonensis TaxID=2791027 RepID=A0ABS0IHW8_9BACT|nr:hypothetical protein [Hymenobacter jeongseonensis]MBF9237963.1 hypothetical protein [Hymenobacter jeongseonensis]